MLCSFVGQSSTKRALASKLRTPRPGTELSGRGFELHTASLGRIPQMQRSITSRRVHGVLAASFMAAILAACAPTTTSPQVSRPAVTPTITTSVLSDSKDRVLDAAIAVMQVSNLSVARLDRQSGLLDVQPALLTAEMLDLYCKYPLINPDGSPHDTFQGWHSRSMQSGGGPVYGIVAISVVVVETQTGSRITIRTNWEARNDVDGSPCQGTGVFDAVAIQSLQDYLRGATEKPILDGRK